jgi:hypothetical protein
MNNRSRCLASISRFYFGYCLIGFVLSRNLSKLIEVRCRSKYPIFLIYALSSLFTYTPSLLHYITQFPSAYICLIGNVHLLSSGQCCRWRIHPRSIRQHWRSYPLVPRHSRQHRRPRQSRIRTPSRQWHPSCSSGEEARDTRCDRAILYKWRFQLRLWNGIFEDGSTLWSGLQLEDNNIYSLQLSRLVGM